MENQINEVKHYQINQRYKIIIERAAGVKTGDGFKVEANGDSLVDVESDIKELYDEAQKIAKKVEVTNAN